MSENFKFKRVGNKFCWLNDYIKIVWSNPNITCPDNYRTIDTLDDAIYFDYSFKIFEKTYLSNGRSTWKEVVGLVPDFPMVEHLKDIVKDVIRANACDGEKREYGNGNICYSLSFDDNDVLEDERWVFKKNTWEFSDEFSKRVPDVTNRDKNEYDVTVGEVSHFGYSKTITLKLLTEEDLNELSACSEAFVKFALVKYNQEVEEVIDEAKRNKFIRNNKLFVTNKSWAGFASIFKAGDKVSISTLKGEGFDNLRIKELQDSEIIFMKENNEEFALPLSELIYIGSILEEKYTSIDDCVSEFLSLFDEDEKTEISLLVAEDFQFCYPLYREAIISRYNLNTNEKLIPWGSPPSLSAREENINNLVREILRRIKGGAI